MLTARTKSVSPELHFGTIILFLVTGVAVFALPMFGQGDASAALRADANAPTYEVGSVRPSKLYGGMSIKSTIGRYSARNVTLWGLIFNAYGLRPNSHIPRGLAGWAESAQFDLEAKMNDDTSAALQKLSHEKQEEKRNRMLQLLLEDRFKLRVHHESREGQIYSLVVGKKGFKLKELPASALPQGRSWNSGQISIRGGSIANLVFCLSDVLDREVVDRTGINGKYDFMLKWTPDEQQGESDAGPTILTALQEQFGLRLESAKGQVDTLVVDHVEQPSVN